MKVVHRIVLLAFLLALSFLVLLVTVGINQDRPLVFHLHRRSECTFRGVVLKRGAVFKEGCEQCVCIGNDNLQCRTIGGCVYDDKIHVVITSDDYTLGGMITLVNSIYHNSNASVVYHLVVPHVTRPRLQTWLDEVPLKHLKFNIIVFPEEWVQDKLVSRGSREDLERPINYARTYLPKLLPDIRSKIIYIDSDCIVQGDIAELWKTRLQPGHIAAFSSDCSHMSKHGNMFNNHLASYLNFNHPLISAEGLRPESCSFNTGVFITDLELWRHYNVTEKLEFWMNANAREEVYGNREGGGGQQPPFLIVFHDRYTELDPFWNVRQLGSPSGLQYSMNFLQSAHLLHWNGRLKPWDVDSRFSEQWYKYYIPDPTGKFHVVQKFRTKQ